MHDRDAVLVGFLVFSSEKPHTVLLQARLLGRMLNRRDMPEEIEFILADGTGAIQARIWYLFRSPFKISEKVDEVLTTND